MKLPQKPPKVGDILSTAFENKGPIHANKVFLEHPGPAPGGKYLHWDKLRYHEPPKGLSPEEWWAGIKLSRQSLYRELPFTDTDGKHFQYAPIDLIYEQLHEIDVNAGGAFQAGAALNSAGIKDALYMKSLLEEAITSSQLEGAATTRMVAKDMLMSGRSPRNHGEQMIQNNYHAMAFIREMGQTPISKEIIFELQSILTSGTLEDPADQGHFRRPGDPVKVIDNIDFKVLHDPPGAEELEERVQLLCDFGNSVKIKPFIHPVLKAIILHFQLAYDHPFVDGNGRTARALFYWAMAKNNYWLCEYLSISSILRKASAKYGRAFLYTETDDNDLTYFILYHLRVIRQAIDQLHQNLEKESQKLRRAENLLRDSKTVHDLNNRQLAILEHALRHPHQRYTFKSHQRANKLSYQTARTDLLGLAQLKLLDTSRQGRAFVFISPNDLHKRIKRL
ncbi:MAG: Fic family protein [Candidatus Marinimicrobia bacterium]|nr:Fic family protein [Candidatus Neomarinimicrobiota bacterium]